MVSQHDLQQGGACSRGGVCSGGSAPGGLPGGVETPPKADGYYCRRYASYWNAFLLLNDIYVYTLARTDQGLPVGGGIPTLCFVKNLQNSMIIK